MKSEIVIKMLVKKHCKYLQYIELLNDVFKSDINKSLENLTLDETTLIVDSSLEFKDDLDFVIDYLDIDYESIMYEIKLLIIQGILDE